jgi:hypothetical protein
MDSIRFRQLRQRDYRDPADILRGMRAAEVLLTQVEDERVRRLRTQGLKEWRETRVAALFCHGYGERIGQKIFFSKGEFEDADCVALWTNEEEMHFAPVQIKEVAPKDLNSKAELQDVLNSLGKYSGTNDLTVLIHLNQQVRFNPNELAIPPNLNISALWLLACISPDQSKWAIWGNYLDSPEKSEFLYPT